MSAGPWGIQGSFLKIFLEELWFPWPIRLRGGLLIWKKILQSILPKKKRISFGGLPKKNFHSRKSAPCFLQIINGRLLMFVMRAIRSFFAWLFRRYNSGQAHSVSAINHENCPYVQCLCLQNIENPCCLHGLMYLWWRHPFDSYCIRSWLDILFKFWTALGRKCIKGRGPKFRENSLSCIHTR